MSLILFCVIFPQSFRVNCSLSFLPIDMKLSLRHVVLNNVESLMQYQDLDAN